MATTAEVVELFIASLRARRTPANTIKSYTHDLRHFVAAVPHDLGRFPPLSKPFCKAMDIIAQRLKDDAMQLSMRSIIGSFGKNWWPRTPWNALIQSPNRKERSHT